jgi:hypothetical protein
VDAEAAINPVYCWGTEEYRARCDSMFVPIEKFLEVREVEFRIPPEITSWRPPVGVLCERGVELVSDISNWFDREPLIQIAREGIDLMADIPPGARPREGVSLWRAKDAEEERYMREEIIGKGMRAGHMRIARKKEESIVNIFPTFLLCKRPGKYRDVINFKTKVDLRKWGREDISFNDATPLTKRPSITPGRLQNVFHMLEWMVRAGVEKSRIRVAKLDIAEAYKHVRIKERVQRQQCFQVGSKIYISLRMQFGTAASASIWCRLINMIDNAFHKLGLGTVSYFDDIILVSISPGAAVRGLRLIRAILRCVGLKVNEDKSDIHGDRHCEFLGIEIDLDRWCARVMEKSVSKIRARCHELAVMCQRSGLEEAYTADIDEERMEEESEELEDAAAFIGDETSETGGAGSVRLLAQKIAGGLNFASSVIKCLKPVRSHFHWLARTGRVRSRKATEHYLRLVLVLLETHNWTAIVHLPYEKEGQHDTGLATDSSDNSMGAVGVDREGNVYYITEKWDEIGDGLRAMHINDKELLSHMIGVQLLRRKVAGGYVVVETLIDNTAAQSWVNKLFAKLDEQGNEAQERRLQMLVDYAEYQQNSGIVVATHYIPSELNVIPDALSRMDTHQHVFDAFVQQVFARGKACTRVRVPPGWRIAKA